MSSQAVRYRGARPVGGERPRPPRPADQPPMPDELPPDPGAPAEDEPAPEEPRHEGRLLPAA